MHGNEHCEYINTLVVTLYEFQSQQWYALADKTQYNLVHARDIVCDHNMHHRIFRNMTIGVIVTHYASLTWHYYKIDNV